MVIMSPFIYPDSSPCSAVIPPWVWYQLLFEQILSPCSISALPITLISGSKGHSKLFSYVRLIPCLLYLLPLSSYHVASNGNLCVLLPALPDQADLYSLTDTHCGTPVFILVLPIVLWLFWFVIIQIFIVPDLDDLKIFSCLLSCKFFLDSLTFFSLMPLFPILDCFCINFRAKSQ